MTHALQFRKKVLKLKKEGESYRKLSKRFQISVTTIRRWEKVITAKIGRNKIWKKVSKEEIIEDINKYPDSYCYERGKRLGCSHAWIWQAMKKMKISYKKNTKTSKAGRRKKIYVLQGDKGYRK